MPLNNLHDLFEHELKDVYAAEQHAMRLLEQAQNQTRDEQMRKAVERHLTETRQQIERLDSVFRNLNLQSSGAHCPVMEGMAKETHEFQTMNPVAELVDVFNVGANVKVERYEISAYETLLDLAAKLGIEDLAAPLQENLREEHAQLERLREVSQRMGIGNAAAAGSQARGPTRSTTR